MNKWTKKQLEELDNITFAITILNERRQSTTNPYSFLNRKINKAIAELEEIKRKNIISNTGKIKKATYTSVWDKATKITTNCKVNMETKEVFDIEMSDSDMEAFDTLNYEYITIDGENHNVVNAEEGVTETDYWYLR